MKTISSIFLAIIAIAAAIYNNPHMLSRFTRLTKHFTPTRNFTTTSTDMASNGMFRGLPVIPDEQFTTTAPRKIAKSFLAVEQSEGAGARVRRSVGTPKLRNFSPFLMLDHFAIPPGKSTLNYTRTITDNRRCWLPRSPPPWARDHHIPALWCCRPRRLCRKQGHYRDW